MNAYFVSFQQDGIGQGAKSEVEMGISGPPDAFKSFKAYCEVMFAGPLKGKSEEKQCNYIMLSVGEKGRNMYFTLNLQSDDKKNFESFILTVWNNTTSLNLKWYMQATISSVALKMVKKLLNSIYRFASVVQWLWILSWYWGWDFEKAHSVCCANEESS